MKNKRIEILFSFYRDHVDDVAKLARDNGKAYDLFMLLIKHMDGTNALCVSNKALQELLSCSKPTVCKAVNYLRDNGWICVLKKWYFERVHSQS